MPAAYAAAPGDATSFARPPRRLLDATDRTVAASTQTQALSALLFLYKHVLKIDLPLLDAVRAKRPKQLPVVLIQRS